MKKCTVCKDILNYDRFYKSKTEKDGYNYRCKSCDKEARLRSRNRPIPRETNKTVLGYRRRWIMLKYRLSLGEYEDILEKQGNCCAICKTTNPRGAGVVNDKNISFAVDHDHTTGQVRGLLCNLCNRALGFFQDSADITLSAYNYLIQNKDLTDDSGTPEGSESDVE